MPRPGGGLFGIAGPWVETHVYQPCPRAQAQNTLGAGRRSAATSYRSKSETVVWLRTRSGWLTLAVWMDRLPVSIQTGRDNGD